MAEGTGSLYAGFERPQKVELRWFWERLVHIKAHGG